MKKSTLISYLLITYFVSGVYAETYFVSKDGKDSYPGTEALPWKTIQKAADTLTAGDTVYIKVGIYNERVIIQNSGEPENYIVFSNYQNDAVSIDGTGISWGGEWNGLVDITEKKYIRINGFQVINADYGGIWIYRSSHIVVNQNYTYNTFSCGIGIWSSHYVSVENNEVELACNDGEQECISVADSSYCEIFGNNVHDNGPGTEGGEGIDVKEGSHHINVFGNEVHHLNNRLGIYADAWDKHTYRINIYQNIIHHCSAENGISVSSEKGGLIEKVNIYNNVVFMNDYCGIQLGSWSTPGFSGSNPVRHIKIINNTFYKNGESAIVIDNPDAVDIVIRNNLCSENGNQIALQQIKRGGTVDHNLFYGANDAPGALYGDNQIIGNPLFLNVDLYNFHLQRLSPAINRGSFEDAPISDFGGNLRIDEDGFDIGAFEY